MSLEEKTIRETTIYQGKKLSLSVAESLLPNGKEATREVVHRAENAVILAITEEGNVIMEKQFRHAFSCPIEALPAGKKDQEDRDILVTAKRELEEETGYVASSWEKLGEFYPAPAYSDEICTAFLAKGLCKTRQHWDEDELLEVFPLSLQEVQAKIKDGSIRDMRSVLAISLYLLKTDSK